MPVACNRPEGDGVRVQVWYLTPGAGVACDMSWEGGT